MAREERDAYLKQIEEQYQSVETQSYEPDSDVLLLPMAPTTSEEPSLADQVTGINRVEVERIIIRLEKEKAQAQFSARIYRDLAEKTKQEKRELSNKLNKRVETVRDFWRNNICEGKTRGGRMVRAALSKKSD